MKKIPCPIASAEVVKKDELRLTLKGPSGNESLHIEGEYPHTEMAISLFDWLGCMHLVAPYLPREIRTNFGMPQEIRNLIGLMYKSENQKAPTFISPKSSRFIFDHVKTYPNRVVVALSGGKDSLWNMWRAQERFGTENVLAVHIAGLNRRNASGEREYAALQAKRFGFNFRIIDLHNGSIETGFRVMRSRDMLLTALISPLAIEFGASHIITEGFAEGNSGNLFTGQEENMLLFSDLLGKLGVPVAVGWENKREIDIVLDLAINRPDWLKLVHNCFAPPNYKIHLNKCWHKKTPTMPMWESQCGSCVKCRIVRLALLKENRGGRIAREDAIKFLKNTGGWINKKWATHSDMISGSPLETFKELCLRYGVEFKFKPATQE